MPDDAVDIKPTNRGAFGQMITMLQRMEKLNADYRIFMQKKLLKMMKFLHTGIFTL